MFLFYIFLFFISRYTQHTKSKSSVLNQVAFNLSAHCDENLRREVSTFPTKLENLLDSGRLPNVSVQNFKKNFPILIVFLPYFYSFHRHFTPKLLKVNTRTINLMHYQLQDKLTQFHYSFSSQALQFSVLFFFFFYNLI